MRSPIAASSGGFTLLEMMIVTTVASILLAIALPSLSTIVVRSRLSSQANALVGDLSLARSEAVRRATTVSVCASADGATCAGSSVWTTGRIVFVDIGADGAFSAGTDLLLRTYRETATGEAVTTLPARTAVTFRADGTLTNLTTYTVCHTGHTGYRVSLTNIGRPRLMPTATVC